MAHVNFMPQALQLALRRRRHLRAWAFLVAGALPMAGLPVALEAMHRSQKSDLAAQYASMQTELATLRAESKAVSVQVANAADHLERADALRAKRAWSAMFAMIGRVMPRECWLTGVATDPPSPASGQRARRKKSVTDPAAEPESVVIDAPRKIKIAGLAANADEPYRFVTALKGTGVFKNVMLVGSRAETVLDSEYHRFNLECEW